MRNLEEIKAPFIILKNFVFSPPTPFVLVGDEAFALLLLNVSFIASFKLGSGVRLLLEFSEKFSFAHQQAI